MIYGATKEEWERFIALGLTAHLLPVVSNPNAVIASHSTMKSLGKTPSLYNAQREVVGLAKWTERQSSDSDIARWSRESDYGICLQTRSVRAIDIDVPDFEAAEAIRSAIGIKLPMRYRSNSGKCLLAFPYAQPMPKRVIPVEGGIVEFLGDGQQFIAAGQHESGVRYEWSNFDLFEDIEALSSEQLERIWQTLCALFATGEPKIAREKREGTYTGNGSIDDVADWLLKNWEVYDEGSEGQLFLKCPFESEHTSEGNHTSTGYFLAGTGGYEQGHWVCLHAHCQGRSDHDFNRATGYIGSSFSALPVVVSGDGERPKASIGYDPTKELADLSEETWPAFKRNTIGILPTAGNLTAALTHPVVCRKILAFDSFRQEIVYAPYGENPPQWQMFTDSDYVDIRVELENRGFLSFGKEMLRDCVHRAALFRTIDTAQIWLKRLSWDGVERIDRFMADYMGAADTPYAKAVSGYIWTALAGRVLQPGVQADMMPIFHGRQGARKTTAIKAMLPSKNFYGAVDLRKTDDDLSRKTRGKLIVEWEELRGLNSRDSEEIKAWVTRSTEEWVPKFKEFPTFYDRRFIVMGTTNPIEVLADGTGERRYLPDTVGIAGPIMIDAIERDREQLWAEGAMRFLLGGVEWQDAERLAENEHWKFKVRDLWDERVDAWTKDVPEFNGKVPPFMKPEGFTVSDALAGIGFVSVDKLERRHKIRMETVLRRLGFDETNGRWRQTLQ